MTHFVLWAVVAVAAAAVVCILRWARAGGAAGTRGPCSATRHLVRHVVISEAGYGYYE